MRHGTRAKTVQCVSSSQVTIKFCNAQSVCNKLAELNVLLQSSEAEIVCFAESWLTAGYPDALLSGSGAYHVFRADRNSRGGGVLILVHKGIPVITIPVSDALEIVCVDLIAKAGRYRVACVYFPPRQELSQVKLLCDALQLLLDCPHPMLIVGDFNLQIDWTLKTNARGVAAQKFLEFVVTAGLEQLISEPTRHDALLDLALSTDRNAINSVKIVEPFSSSDHNSLLVTIPWVEPKLEPVCYRSFRKADWSAVRGYLGSLDWAYLIGHCSTVHQVWDLLYGHLCIAIQMHVPLATYTPGLSVLPQYIRKMRSHRRRLFRQRNGPLGAAKYRSYNATYKRKMRNFCIKQEKRVLAGNSIKSLYGFIKKKTKAKSAIPSLQSTGTAVQTDVDKAEIVNEFFASVFNKDKANAEQFPDRVFQSGLSNFEITPFMVNKLLSKLPNILSCGPDGIPTYFYKQCQHVLALPLALLFQMSLDSAEIPSIWKRSIVVPIFKKGNRSLPTNYRPVSLLCAISLIFERCIKQKIVTHIETNKLLSEDQFGFRRGRSVEVQLFACLEEWTAALDR